VNRERPPCPLPALLLLTITATGCGHSRPPDAEPAQRLDPIHIHATRDGERLDLDAYDASELFERAGGNLRSGSCQTAVKIYDRLCEEFSGSPLVPLALYNRGLCLDELERYQEAAASYGRMVRDFPGSQDVTDALFRMAGSFEAMEAWDQVVEALDRLLSEHPDLGRAERIEALARKGSALLEMDRVDDARLALEAASRTHRIGRGIAPSDSNFYYSMAEFKLAEIVHDAMRQEEIPSDESILEEHLERKAGLLLDAQRLYTKVIRIGHPHWAAAAAYRIGALYHHLWKDMLAAPPPEDLDEEEREIYQEILREKIRVLLKKAVLQWERTLKLASRLGLDNKWVESTQRDLDEIRDILVLEKSGEGAIEED